MKQHKDIVLYFSAFAVADFLQCAGAIRMIYKNEIIRCVRPIAPRMVMNSGGSCRGDPKENVEADISNENYIPQLSSLHDA